MKCASPTQLVLGNQVYGADILRVYIRSCAWCYFSVFLYFMHMHAYICLFMSREM